LHDVLNFDCLEKFFRLKKIILSKTFVGGEPHPKSLSKGEGLKIKKALPTSQKSF
jgi:hypothetical protein